MSTSSSASPFPVASGPMSLRTPVEVSACTTAMIAGAGWAARSRCGSIGSPHGASTRMTSAPSRPATSHIRSPKTPLTPTTTGSAGPHEVHERRLHACRSRPADRQGQGVRRSEDLTQTIVRVVEQPEELRIEVSEHGSRQCHRDLRVRV